MVLSSRFCCGNRAPLQHRIWKSDRNDENVNIPGIFFEICGKGVINHIEGPLFSWNIPLVFEKHR